MVLRAALPAKQYQWAGIVSRRFRILETIKTPRFPAYNSNRSTIRYKQYKEFEKSNSNDKVFGSFD